MTPLPRKLVTNFNNVGVLTNITRTEELPLRVSTIEAKSLGRSRCLAGQEIPW